MIFKNRNKATHSFYSPLSFVRQASMQEAAVRFPIETAE